MKGEDFLIPLRNFNDLLFDKQRLLQWYYQFKFDAS